MKRYVLDKFIENRIHEIGEVYQQKFKDELEQDLSYAFIPLVNNFSSMPDEIYLLLANAPNKVIAHESPFEHIMVSDDAYGKNVVEGTSQMNV